MWKGVLSAENGRRSMSSGKRLSRGCTRESERESEAERRRETEKIGGRLRRSTGREKVGGGRWGEAMEVLGEGREKL